MTKKDLVKLAARNVSMPQKEVSVCLDSILSSITELLSNGENLAFHNFGTFSVKEVKARRTRNPATGQTILKDATKKVQFTPRLHLDENKNMHSL